MESQGNCCVYCGVDFDTPVWNEKRLRYGKPQIHWDNFIPFAFAGTGGQSNAVAACAECNMVKRDRVFGSIDEARVAILHDRGLL